MLVPADPAAKLVHLGQAEPVGVVYENCVGVRDVQARFDNGCAYEYVDVSGYEVYHRVLKLMLGHLAVGDCDFGIADELLNLPCLLINRPDPVVHEKDLSLAVQFADYAFSYEFAVIAGDACYYAASVQRRRGKRANVTKTQKRHIQGSRNRRGRHRENVNVDAHSF